MKIRDALQEMYESGMKCPFCDSKLYLKGFKINKKRAFYYWCKKCSVGFKPHELLVMRKEGEAE